MVWFTVLGILLTIVCYFILTRRQERGALMSPKPKVEVGAMSLEEARTAFDNLIAEGGELYVGPADSATPLPEGLGPITREFFSRYGTLKTRLGGFELSAAGIRASEYIHGFVSIGHSEDWDVVQRLGNDEVFVVEGSETQEAEMETRFPSIYHLAVDEAMT